MPSSSWLEAYGLEPAVMREALARLQASHPSFADLYFQKSHRLSLSFEEQKLKTYHDVQDHGLSVRLVHEDRCSMAISSLLSAQALHACVQRALQSARSACAGKTHVMPVQVTQNIVQPYAWDHQSETLQTYARFLMDIDAHVRAWPEVSDCRLHLVCAHDEITLWHEQGVVHDIRPLIRLNIEVIVMRQGVYETGYAGCGGRYDPQQLLSPSTWQPLCRQAYDSALEMLEAEEAPSGRYPCVLGPGWPAVLLHEAVGHGLEADGIRKKSSMYWDKMGQQIASPLVTVVDDGTLPGLRGSLNYDDEGCATQVTPLIEDGIMTGIMTDRMNAHLLGLPLTGNGRRESYACRPLPRMTNTLMLPGKSDPQAMLDTLDKGIYAVNFSGGQVDTASGQFVFSLSQAYWVEKGRILYPIKGATLIGSGVEVMQNIIAVGNDFKMDPGIGVCGKEGQSVPVGVGQPSVQLRHITVGGTQR